MDDNKSKALAAALSQIEKQFGKGSIMRMGDTDIAGDVQAVSTGSLGLDIALGIGGLPRGRVIEIYGPESSGKADGIAFEVITKAEVTQHLKEGVVTRGVTDVFEVIMFTARSNTALRRRSTGERQRVLASKDVFELDHARVGKQQGRVIAGHQR
jgi:hypothetical protein